MLDAGWAAGCTCRRLEQLVHGVPVDHVPPRGDVVGALVLVLQVVGVLPDVEAEQRCLAFHQRAVLVWRARYLHAVAALDQPRPATAEARRAGLRERLLERIEGA